MNEENLNRVLKHMVRVPRIPRDGEAYELSPEPAQLQYLAKELDLESIDRLTGEVVASPWGSGGATLKGKLKIDLVQCCVASLEPIPSTLNISFERKFAPLSASEEYFENEMVLDPEADDEPDILERDYIDLWEVVREELVLCIDPFPRKSDFVLTATEETGIDTPNIETRKPFADLEERLAQKSDKK